MSRKVLSLTEGNIRKVIISFAWPVFISSIFAELYNITNSMIVGNYVSLRALSAVSACTWICNIFNFTFFGLGMGTGIIVARYYGAKDYENLEKSLDTAIIFAVVGGIALTVLSEMFLPVLMKICNITGDIYGDARDYLRVYFLGNTAVLTSQMCFYILRSFGDTRHQLYFSIISSIVNVVLGVIFVRFLGMNITGTALATIISQFVMDILALRQMIRIDGVNFDIRNLHFSFRTVMEICRLGIPAGFQNMLIALSSMVVQSYVNMFPNEVIAGIGVGEKLTNWGQMYSVAVSSATMALVAQNLGAERYDRARESIRESAIISSAATLFSIVVLFISAPLLVSRFSDSAEAVEYGVQMIRWSVFSMFFISLSHIYNAACRGAGNVRAPMIVGIIGQVIVKYLFVFIGLKVFYDVHILYLASATGFVVAGLLAVLYFYTSRWSREHNLR